MKPVQFADVFVKSTADTLMRGVDPAKFGITKNKSGSYVYPAGWGWGYYMRNGYLSMLTAQSRADQLAGLKGVPTGLIHMPGGTSPSDPFGDKMHADAQILCALETPELLEGWGLWAGHPCPPIVYMGSRKYSFYQPLDAFEAVARICPAGVVHDESSDSVPPRDPRVRTINGVEGSNHQAVSSMPAWVSWWTLPESTVADGVFLAQSKKRRCYRFCYRGRDGSTTIDAKKLEILRAWDLGMIPVVRWQDQDIVWALQ